MRIEEGKYYRTRDGRKVGPAKKYFEGRFELDGAHFHCHSPDGKYRGSDSSLDLISEWTEGPIVTETVTVRRIEPGVYGRLIVTDDASDGNGVGLKFASRLGGELGSLGAALSAPELREMARVALEIAEYLDAQ